jgi:hypothetical protein
MLHFESRSNLAFGMPSMATSAPAVTRLWCRGEAGTMESRCAIYVLRDVRGARALCLRHPRENELQSQIIISLLALFAFPVLEMKVRVKNQAIEAHTRPEQVFIQGRPSLGARAHLMWRGSSWAWRAREARGLKDDYNHVFFAANRPPQHLQLLQHGRFNRFTELSLSVEATARC